MVKRDIVTDDSGFTDHHAHAMVDEKPAADGGARMNLDTGQHARQMCREAAQPAKAVPPEPMGDTMQDQGVNARIAGQNLPERAYCRIAVKDRTNILTQIPEHGS